MRHYRVLDLLVLIGLTIPIALISCKLVTGVGEVSSTKSIITPLASLTDSALMSEIPETVIPLGENSTGDSADWSQAVTPPASELSENLHFKGQLGGVSYAVDKQGSIAFLGVGPRLVALDLSNPANPQLTQIYKNSGLAMGIDVQGNLVCVADGDGGLLLLD